MKISMNPDWRFHLGDEVGADYMGHNDSAWRKVTLPHDWSVEHPFDKSNASGTGYLPGGTAWYRKHFTLPDSISQKRVKITFGGVYKHARVWINSNYLGERAYGYSTFTHDITPFVRPGENVVCVRVEHNEVADSRWFTGSGIYRDVTLDIQDECGFTENGIFVHTVSADETKAEICVEYDTYKADGARFIVKAGDGQTVFAGDFEGESGKAQIEIANPALWSCEQPTLYSLISYTIMGSSLFDETVIPFGIRTFSFDGDKGFFLNGVNMKMKGICVHHDSGALGAASYREVWKRRLEKLKKMGANALRTAHNPPDPMLLDLCDEMGFLVMDEAFDEWEGTKNKWWQGHNVYPPKRYGYAEDFPQWYEKDLTGMVLRDRNHPSIILWSIGNEIDYPNDPYVTPLFKEVLGNNDANKPMAERLYDVRKPDAGRLAYMARVLTEIVHCVDSTRPVTSALSFPELSNLTGYADELDVIGYNYKEVFYEADHKKYPGRVIYGSENSKDAKAWLHVRDNDYISGQFLWTGIDFLGECRGWPNRISQAGLIDLAGFEKPGYYHRMAMWTEKPFVKIAVGHEDDKWDGPESEKFFWNDEDGRMMRVSVYTNQKECELILNGKSLGKKETDDNFRAVWFVPFEKGVLKAISGDASDEVRTAEKAAKIVLTPDTDVLSKGKLSVSNIEVSLLDANGDPAAYDEEIHYQIVGDAEIIGIENGQCDDLTAYLEKYRNTYQSRAIVYLRSGNMAGDITLYAWTYSGLSAAVTMKQQ